MKKEVIIGVNQQTRKVYFNPKFMDIPKSIKEELQDKIIKLAEETKGIVLVSFYNNGNVYIEQQDAFADEIAVDMAINNFINNNRQLINSLKTWYLMYRTREGKLAREIFIHNSRKHTPQEFSKYFSTMVEDE
ncbi:MAG: hypothetical protein BEN19_05235 [Epulopiscium sp. Nuni2H_MBin003]|nr:MAG: hypothetical protein BEN19_05235 [Epulopiscium sp. Nuni2H_MBin003]